MASNVSSSAFSSMLASSKYGGVALPPQIDYVLDTVSNASIWTILLTLLAVCVAYDQSMLPYPQRLSKNCVCHMSS